MSTWPALADPAGGFGCDAAPHGEYGDWASSWPQEEDQDDDVPEGFNYLYYTHTYF